MSLYFLTGNINKFSEAQVILGEVEQLDVDLPELQDIDAKLIIGAKLSEALKHHQGGFIVEDTSLYLDCLNGLPGPLIKWFLQTIGNEGLANLAVKLGNDRANAKTLIGYAKNPEEIYFFEGEVTGRIVSPSGETNFGWDPIFIPEGSDKTFAQMSKEEKNSLSMRRVALNKLRDFLNEK